MGKFKNKIASFLIIIFVIFAIFYSIITLTPLIYLVIAGIIIILIVIIIAYYLYTKENKILPIEIYKFIWNFIQRQISSKPSKRQGGTITPPLPPYEKDRIIIEIAKGKCEYTNCNEEGSLEVHHIIPRFEGGGNAQDNLIVLCPSHHTMADRGNFPRSRLKYIIKNMRR